MKLASEVATNSMRVFIMSLLAVAAAHASAPAAWGGAHVTTLGKVDASSGSNLALRGGFDTIKNMVSLAIFSLQTRDATNVVIQAHSLCRHHPCTLLVTLMHIFYIMHLETIGANVHCMHASIANGLYCAGCFLDVVFNIDAGKK